MDTVQGGEGCAPGLIELIRVSAYVQVLNRRLSFARYNRVPKVFDHGQCINATKLKDFKAALIFCIPSLYSNNSLYSIGYSIYYSI
jgi:hypothetical protein